MARREWARSSVSRFQLRIQEHGPEPLVQATTAATLLQAEHARAIRLVKAEIKRVKLDQHVFTAQTKGYLLEMLNHLLTALQRGRGGKG